MKKIIPLLCLLLCAQFCFAQIDKAARSILKFSAYKDDNVKVDSLISNKYVYSVVNEPKQIIKLGQILLEQSLKRNDFLLQSYAYFIIGSGYRFLGNSSKGLLYNQKSVDLAVKSGNPSLIAYSKNAMGHIYKDREDWKEALKIYSSAVYYSKKGNNKKVICGTSMNLGVVYLEINKLDSALIYLQNAYETQDNDINAESNLFISR
jgi:tetratricopeptide (TPR) repeat protein